MCIDIIDKVTFDGAKKAKFLAPLLWMLLKGKKNKKKGKAWLGYASYKDSKLFNSE